MVACTQTEYDLCKCSFTLALRVLAEIMLPLHLRILHKSFEKYPTNITRANIALGKLD